MTDDARLPSWRDTPNRQAVLDFVEGVIIEGGEHYVPPADRIAVFDNDGTLWSEKPMPIELAFTLRRLAEMADADPSLQTLQPWKAAYEKDYAWLSDVITQHYHGDDTNVKVLMGGMVRAFAGLTVRQYEDRALAFLDAAPHPSLGRRMRDCTYLPMVELLHLLEGHGFTSYIASGGDRDFMRPVTEELYGIPAERVIGSSNGLRFEPDGSDGGQLVYQAQPDIFDDGPMKPVRIWSRTGRRPLVAGGNSNGDIPMLQYAKRADRPALRLLLLHDDADREFAYVGGAEASLETARANGWTVVSMKNDWATVFATLPGDQGPS